MTQTAFRYRPRITLEVNRRRHTVYLDEICYLQSDKHAVEVFMNCGRQIRVWVPLRELESQMGPGFLRLNRGTIVNMSQIEQMDIDTCTLWDGTRLELTAENARQSGPSTWHICILHWQNTQIREKRELDELSLFWLLCLCGDSHRHKSTGIDRAALLSLRE